MSRVCEKLHIATSGLPRNYFPIEKDKIYKNGIYIYLKKEKSLTE